MLLVNRHLQTKSQYFPLFDGLRLALAMTVALGHSGLAIGHDSAGNFAVQVFFALSGWLIGGILLDTVPAGLDRFYYNRAIRIWVPYFLSVLILFCTSLLKENIDFSWFEYLFYEITYTHNVFITPNISAVFASMPLGGTNNHYWSLSVEEQFYLFAPIVCVYLSFGRRPLFWGFVSAAAVLTQSHFGSIALGMLAVTLSRQYGDWHQRPLAIVGLGVIIIAGFTLCGIRPYSYPFVAPFVATAIMLLLARNGRSTKIGAVIGGISYPLYLNHWIGIFLGNEVAQRFPLIGDGARIALSAALNLIIAFGLYLVIDRNIQRRRDDWYTEQSGRFARISAYGLVIAGILGGLMIAVSRELVDART